MHTIPSFSVFFYSQYPFIFPMPYHKGGLLLVTVSYLSVLHAYCCFTEDVIGRK